MLSVSTYIICQTDMFKYMLSRPIMRGRIRKWAFPLIKISLQFRSQRSEKGQAITNFLTDHPLDPKLLDLEPSVSLVTNVSLIPWTLIFDGAKNAKVTSTCIIIISTKNRKN